MSAVLTLSETDRLKATIAGLQDRLARTLEEVDTQRLATVQMQQALDRAGCDINTLAAEVRRKVAEIKSLKERLRIAQEDTRGCASA